MKREAPRLTAFRRDYIDVGVDVIFAGEGNPLDGDSARAADRTPSKSPRPIESHTPNRANFLFIVVSPPPWNCEDKFDYRNCRKELPNPLPALPSTRLTAKRFPFAPHFIRKG